MPQMFDWIFFAIVLLPTAFVIWDWQKGGHGAGMLSGMGTSGHGASGAALSQGTVARMNETVPERGGARPVGATVTPAAPDRAAVDTAAPMEADLHPVSSERVAAAQQGAAGTEPPAV